MNFLKRLMGMFQDAPCSPPQPTPEEDPERLRYIRRERLIITDLIAAWLPANHQFLILDGGARSAFDDPRWNVFDPGRVRLFGFEVDEKECADLNRLARERGLDYHFFSVGLWSRPARKTFYENKSSGGGSFFAQNSDFTNRWKFENAEQKFLAREMFYPTGTTEWDLTSVEVWARNNGVDDLDFMKLNVQGAELEILKGMGGLLERVIGIQTEISLSNRIVTDPFSQTSTPFFANITSCFSTSSATTASAVQSRRLPPAMPPGCTRFMDSSSRDTQSISRTLSTWFSAE